MKKIFLLVVCLAAVAVFAGCGKQENRQGEQGRNFRGMNASSTFKIDLPKGTAADLTVGKSVMVMGEAGSDGSISAKQIVIGDGDPGMFFGNHRPREFSSSTTSTPPFDISTPPVQDENFQPPSGDREFNGPPSDGQFQGSGHWQGGNGGQFQGQRRPGNVNVARVFGKILKMDDTSITVEIQGGGSKLVLYSDKTEIYLAQPPAITTSTSIVTSSGT